MYTMSSEKEMTPARVKRYLDAHAAQEARCVKLQKYYKGEHTAILNRTFEDETKPNNRIVNPYAQYITDIMSGYFMGEAVTYSCADEAQLDELKQVLTYNDEAAENSELATAASINGMAYELLYIDDDGMLRFKSIDPAKAIPIYDNTIEQELLYFIRYYDENDIESNQTTRFVEVYSHENVVKYQLISGTLSHIETLEHAFGMVPVCVYLNNSNAQGDFETSISLIDAYDRAQSDMVNDQDYFSDAYMTLTGAEGTDENQITAMKTNRVLLLPQGVSAGWLTKADTTSTGESILTRIDNSIHKFSKCPAMTDKDFAGNSSGVAMRYKLMGLEDATAKKEREFKRGLQRRLELIFGVIGVIGRAYDWRAVNITFNRNIPSNLDEAADTVNKIGDLISKEARVNLLPIDIDYAEDLEKQKQEAVSGYSEYRYSGVLEEESGEQPQQSGEDSGDVQSRAKENV